MEDLKTSRVSVAKSAAENVEDTKRQGLEIVLQRTTKKPQGDCRNSVAETSKKS